MGVKVAATAGNLLDSATINDPLTLAAPVDRGLQCLARLFLFLFFLFLPQTTDDYRCPLLRPRPLPPTVKLCSNKPGAGRLACLVIRLAKRPEDLAPETVSRWSCPAQHTAPQITAAVRHVQSQPQSMRLLLRLLPLVFYTRELQDYV